MATRPGQGKTGPENTRKARKATTPPAADRDPHASARDPVGGTRKQPVPAPERARAPVGIWKTLLETTRCPLDGGEAIYNVGQLTPLNGRPS